MQLTNVLGFSKFKLVIWLASIWLLLVSLLLLDNYYTEKSHVFSELLFKTQSGAMQYELLIASQVDEDATYKKEFLYSLANSFHPTLDLTIISKNGRIASSTLEQLNQLSYSPVLHQFSNDIKCIESLGRLLAEPLSGCMVSIENAQSFFLASLSTKAFRNFWLQKNKHYLVASLISFLAFGLLVYLLSLIQAKILTQEVENSLKYKQKDEDFKRLISNLPGLVYRFKVTDKKLMFVSSGSLQLLGYPPEHFMQNDLTPFDLIDDDDINDFTQQSHSARFSLKPFELVYRVNSLSGERKWVLDRGRCIKDQDGQHFVEGVMLDITERELVRQQIEYLAIQDPLTELYNRYKFNDELVDAVDDATRKKEHFAMLFIDLDRFKNINDSLGHQLGDRLLRKVASRLQTLVPEQHFLARMGGDEFVVLMRNIVQKNEIELLADKINSALRKPFNIDSYQLRTSCSIGISLCPDDSTQSHILWRYADTAMYQIKNRGGDGYQFFTSKMGDLVQQRIKIEHGFIPGLEHKEFELYFQPQVDINTGKVLGAEALIRWNHPTLGFISPAEFIPIAEETGFIHELGDWIIHESLTQLERWQKINPRMTMAVNVSALQITQEFPDKIASFLKQYHINKNTLELEITESLLMENIGFVQPLLSKVCDHDVFFAIDDFGTGYSSLSYLRYLPINKLKIDRAFVMNLETNQEDVAMVKAIISMSKNLNLKVLAEGIETQSQLRILQEQGCDSFQGYLFSRPVDKDTFYDLYINCDQTITS